MSKDKTAKKLRLDTETLRILGTDLAEVLGGNGNGNIKSLSLSITEKGCPQCCNCNGTGP